MSQNSQDSGNHVVAVVNDANKLSLFAITGGTTITGFGSDLYTSSTLYRSAISDDGKWFIVNDTGGTIKLIHNTGNNTTAGRSLTVYSTGSYYALSGDAKVVVSSAGLGSPYNITRQVVGGILTTNYIVARDSASINGALSVAGESTFTSKVVALADISVNSTMSLGGNATLGGALAVSGATTMAALSASTIAASGLISGSAGLTISAGTITVPVGSIAQSAIANYNVFAGTVSIGTDLSLNGDLNMAGDASFNQNVYIQKDLIVDGKLSVKSYNNEYIINTTTTDYTLIVAEDLSLNGRMFVADDVLMNAKLGVASDFNVNTDKFTVAAATGNTVVAGTLVVSGATTTMNALSASTIAASGLISGSAGLTITAGLVSMANDLSLNGNLRMAGSATLASVSATSVSAASVSVGSITASGFFKQF
jgi:hypothetical protein